MLEQIHLDYGHIIRPLLVGTFVAAVCSVVGCFIILRKMSFLADAIAHAMLAGVVGGYLLIKLVFGHEAHLGAMLLGAMLAGIITVGMVGIVTRFSRLKEDTAIGIMYTGIFALGALAISIRSVSQHVQIDIYHYLVGSVLAVSDAEIWLLAIVASIVFSVVILFYRSLHLTTFDPVMAASIGIPVLAFDYLLTACTSLVVVSGVQIVGVILVVALVITPAATAYLLSQRLDEMIRLAIGIGVLGFWSGFLLAMIIGGSPGASVVVVMTLIFGLTMVLAPQQGLWANWIEKRNFVSQEVLEDVLGALSRSNEPVLAVQVVADILKSPLRPIKKAVAVLERKGFVTVANDSLKLTEPGQEEAARLIRAHRLWEKYLQTTGTPESELHARAHQLEHITDQTTMDYLDDRLGHPWVDPHGKVIPAARLPKNSVCLLSVLREGDHAEIQKLKSAADTFGLDIGQHVVIGPRTVGADSWTIYTEQGATLTLNHQQADGIIVRLVDSTER